MEFIKNDNLGLDAAREREIAEEVSQKIEKGELKEDQIDEEILGKIKEANPSCKEWQNHYACERIKNMIVGPRFMPAKRSMRFLNLILDYIGLSVFSLLIGFYLGIKGWSFLIENMNDSLLAFIIWMLYYGFFESIWAKTPAKFITRTRVIMEDGTKPPLKTILIRTLIRFVPFEAFTFLAPARPRGWHDKWSKTIVIEETERVHHRSINSAGYKGGRAQEGDAEKTDIHRRLTDEISYCGKCGHKLEKNSKFCSKCGAKI